MSRDTADDQPVQKMQRNEMRMIARAADVLRALAAASGPLSLGQIAQETGLARSTVQRLVGALVAEDFVATRKGLPGVLLGKELLRLGAWVQAHVRSRFRPHLQVLHARTNDTVDLSKLMDGVPIVIDQISSTAALRVVSFVGRPLPLHATASGKAHLKGMTEGELSSFLKQPLQAFTNKTITDSAEILKITQKKIAVDFTYDREEFDEGICAIALPIPTPDGGNYAIAVSMPSQRFKERLPLLREAMLQCQNDMKAIFGEV